MLQIIILLACEKDFSYKDTYDPIPPCCIKFNSTFFVKIDCYIKTSIAAIVFMQFSNAKQNKI